jgi:hypothetical protein
VGQQTSRALTGTERGVLEVMLSARFEGIHTLREQARTVTVSGCCTCGCPSIELRPAPEAPRAPEIRTPVPCIGILNTTNSNPPSPRILLYVVEGWMRYLELVYDSPDPPTHWPRPELITPTPSRW